jgi:hypothetical protein
MRFKRFSVVATIAALSIAPTAASSQVVRDPCFYTRDDCDRRMEAAERAHQRAMEAQDRARERAAEARERAADARDRALEHAREAQERARDRAVEAQERSRRMVVERQARDFEIQFRSQSRSWELQLQRAIEQRARVQLQQDRARDRELERPTRDPLSSRDGYITLPPGVRRRWP